MPGFTNAESAALLDYRYPTSGATDHVMWSEDGLTESTKLPRISIGATGWAAATNADPAVKANSGALVSAAATGACTITHMAVVTAASGGTQRTDWTALPGGGRSLVAGDQLTLAAGALSITLT